MPEIDGGPMPAAGWGGEVLEFDHGSVFASGLAEAHGFYIGHMDSYGTYTHAKSIATIPF